MKALALISLSLFLSINAFAQIETTLENFTESKAILEEIEKENYFKKGAFDIRTGLLQVSANKPADPLKLNSKNEMPFFEVAYERQIKNRWGIAGSLLHAQNALGTGTINGTSAFQQVYQLGAIYKMILDETMIKNYITFKMQYYSMNNNFKLENNQDFYLKSETGILLGVERSVPATELFDVRGSFDFIYVMDAKTESILTYKKTGNGLQIRADAFYNFSKISRLGLGYSISAFFNKYTDADFEARDRHTQTYKGFYLDYSYLF